MKRQMTREEIAAWVKKVSQPSYELQVAQSLNRTLGAVKARLDRIPPAYRTKTQEKLLRRLVDVSEG